jgi:uncharacterized protein (TIGR03435 family)
MADRFKRTFVLIATCLTLALTMAASTQQLPSFEAATIKPIVPGTGRSSGFLSYPGGRVKFEGASVRVLISYAFDVQHLQISGGPTWAGDDRYDVSALPPDSSESRTAKQPPISYTPSREQREMLQSLLAERFGLHYHWDTREGPIYILSRGKKTLALEEPKDKERGPVCAVFVRGDIADGEVRCANASMNQLAQTLAENLELPVINRTGLDGVYDLQVLPFDPSNREITTAIYGAMDRLGLKLERSRGPVKTFVIDSVTMPTAN